MSERQKLGFDFENDYINNNDLIKEKLYTSEFDAYTKKGIPVQIKTYKKGGEIDLGSLKRNLNKDKDFLLVIGCYDNNEFFDKKVLFVEKNKWKKIFHVNEKTLLEMEEFIKNISNDYKDDKKWKEGVSLFKKETSSGIAVPRFKRDHKKQKRIQAAIPNKQITKLLSCFEQVDIKKY